MTAAPTPDPAETVATSPAFRHGSTGADDCRHLVTDALGRAYATRCSVGVVDFDAGIGDTTRTARGVVDVSVARYAIDGAFTCVTTIGSPGADMTYQIHAADDGVMHVAGYVAAGAACGSLAGRAVAGLRDAFVAQLAADGSCCWAVALGGTQNDEARGLGIDAAGNVYIEGVL